MREAHHYEKMFNVSSFPSRYAHYQTLSVPAVMQEFFLTVKDLLRKQPCGVASYLKFSERDKQLLSRSVHCHGLIFRPPLEWAWEQGFSLLVLYHVFTVTTNST